MSDCVYQEILRRQDALAEGSVEQQHGLEDGRINEVYSLLKRRNGEVDILRDSLASAVEEIEDAARIIAELRFVEFFTSGSRRSFDTVFMLGNRNVMKTRKMLIHFVGSSKRMLWI